MCGICGSCSGIEGRRLSTQVIEDMASLICHRGPDGSGYYSDPYATLGHRRLSIIDLHSGDQPIFNEDATIAVVFNGEIYNFKEIRRRLRAAGHSFATRTDTEILVHLYEEKGVDLVDELEGMFAIAIWDSNRRRLFAARDRMGEKPLYFQHRPDGTLNFASELKALLVPLDTAPDISSAALHDYLSYGYVPAPLTIFEGFSKLPAAHRLTWENGVIRVERYWSPQDSQQDQILTEKDALHELKCLLEKSVRLRLRSDVPVGAFLSGGVDSSIIAGIASRLLEQPLQTFVVGFSDDKFDESRYAAEVATAFGTNHHSFVVEDINLDILPRLVRQFDEPFADPSSVPTYFVTQAASSKLKVCLSGDGADEVFGGYDRYFPERFEQLGRTLPRRLRSRIVGSLARAVPDSVPGAGFLGRLASDGADHYQRKIGIFTRDERRQLIRRDFAGEATINSNLFAEYFADDRYTDTQARLRADQQTYLPEDILVKVDRTSMLNSLEVRAPFLDHELVNFANRLPTHLKMRKNVGKYLLKKLLGEMLPKNLVNRPKHGFSLPISAWFRQGYANELKDEILSPGTLLFDYLDKDYVSRLYRTHQEGRRDRSPQLWALLWLELWLQQNTGPGRSTTTTGACRLSA